MLKQLYFEFMKNSGFNENRYFQGCFFGGICGLIKFVTYIFGSLFASFESTMEVLSSHLYITNHKWFQWKIKIRIQSETTSWGQHFPEIMAQITYFYAHSNLLNMYSLLAFITTILVVLIEICMHKMETPEYCARFVVYFFFFDIIFCFFFFVFFFVLCEKKPEKQHKRENKKNT